MAFFSSSVLLLSNEIPNCFLNPCCAVEKEASTTSKALPHRKWRDAKKLTFARQLTINLGTTISGAIKCRNSVGKKNFFGKFRKRLNARDSQVFGNFFFSKKNPNLHSRRIIAIQYTETYTRGTKLRTGSAFVRHCKKALKLFMYVESTFSRKVFVDITHTEKEDDECRALPALSSFSSYHYQKQGCRSKCIKNGSQSYAVVKGVVVCGLS